MDDEGFSTVTDVDNLPGMTIDFGLVPERKTQPNRMHWDVSARSVEPLLDAGATVVRQQGGDIAWHVLADPEGNEFCVFGA